MGMRTLRITVGPGAGQTREIDSELVIGREGADLTIDDSELSRRHVALRPVERGVEIEDLGSLNGTFVNGERISSPVTLTAPGTLKVGVSQATVEVSLPQVTRMAETPEGPGAPPGATVVRPAPDSEDAADQEPVADPDVTVQRPTAKPDGTARRPVQQPEVTAQRPTAKPDVTAQRPVQQPEVTARRPTAKPDVTVQRPVGTEGPPQGATPPPSAPPPKPPEDGGSRSGGPPRGLIIGVVIAVLALIVVLVLLTSGGEAAAKKRPVEVTLRVAAITPEDARVAVSTPGPKDVRMVFAGKADGSPFGAGNVTLDIVREAVKPRRPPVLTARSTFRFDGGALVGTVRFGPVESPPGTIRFQGNARLFRGTGDFEGVKGTIKMTGERPNAKEAIEKIKMTGSAEY